MNSTMKTVFSARWTLLKIEVKKIFKGFLIGLAGAICAYLEASFIPDLKEVLVVYLSPQVMTLALGFLVAINSAIINTLHKYVTTATYVNQQ